MTDLISKPATGFISKAASRAVKEEGCCVFGVHTEAPSRAALHNQPCWDPCGMHWVLGGCRKGGKTLADTESNGFDSKWGLGRVGGGEGE